MSSVQGTRPTKVRIIVTEFVQTDARQFKSVVQTLTGKDSHSAVAGVAAETSGGLGESAVARHPAPPDRGGDAGASKRPLDAGIIEAADLLPTALDELFEMLRD